MTSNSVVTPCSFVLNHRFFCCIDLVYQYQLSFSLPLDIVSSAAASMYFCYLNFPLRLVRDFRFSVLLSIASGELFVIYLPVCTSREVP